MTRQESLELIRNLAREDHFTALYAIGYLMPDLSDEQVRRLRQALTEFGVEWKSHRYLEIIEERYGIKPGG